MLKKLSTVTTVCLLLLVGGLAACESKPMSVKATTPTLSVSANNKKILAGESTTIFASSQNMIGRNPQVQWSTTMGRIEPMDNGSYARFTSENTGTAIITARVRTQEGLVLTDQTEVQVNSIQQQR